MRSKFKLVKRTFHTQTQVTKDVFVLVVEKLAEGGGIIKILISPRGQN